MLATLGLSLLMLTPTPPVNDIRLSLSASATRPFVDQQVRLILELQVPAGDVTEPLQLRIPWLRSEFGFRWSRAPDAWLQGQRQLKSGLRVQIAGEHDQVLAEPVPSSVVDRKRYRLTWLLAVNEPDELQGGTITFHPVRSGSNSASNPLTLNVRKLPLPPPDLPALYLGVGTWQMAVNVREKQGTIGSAIPIIIRVFGDGAPERIIRPAPGKLWRDDRWRLELADLDDKGDKGDEAIDEPGRWFRYDLHPRTPGPHLLPPIPYVCFDPRKETFVRSETPALLVRSTSRRVAPASGFLLSPGEIQARLQPLPLDVSALTPRNREVPKWLIALVLGSPPLVWLGLWTARRRLWPSAWPENHRRPSAAARQAIQALERKQPALSPEELASVCTAYLQRQHGWLGGEPTLTDLLAHFGQRKADMNAARELGEVFEHLAAARFGRIPAIDASLRHRAVRAIRRLEGQA